MNGVQMNRFSLKMMKTMDLCTFELNIFFIRFLLRVSVCVCVLRC